MAKQKIKLNYDSAGEALYIKLSDEAVEATEVMQPGVTVHFDARHQVVGIGVLGVPDRSEGDRKWDALFASTTPEQIERLEKMFGEEDEKEDTPLDFANR